MVENVAAPPERRVAGDGIGRGPDLFDWAALKKAAVAAARKVVLMDGVLLPIERAAQEPEHD
jgi:hypothetical protein